MIFIEEGIETARLKVHQSQVLEQAPNSYYGHYAREGFTARATYTP
jgi:hypothetical protein